MRAKTKPTSLLRQPEAPGSVRQQEPAVALPPAFLAWFAQRGWRPRTHQLALLEKAAQRRSTLLIAPTGAGKTLAGFLPSLVALSESKRARGERAIHTLLHLAAQGAGGRRPAQPADPPR
jgi:ATP-dependent Lhr-like helicase